MWRKSGRSSGSPAKKPGDPELVEGELVPAGWLRLSSDSHGSGHRLSVHCAEVSERAGIAETERECCSAALAAAVEAAVAAGCDCVRIVAIEHPLHSGSCFHSDLVR